MCQVWGGNQPKPTREQLVISEHRKKSISPYISPLNLRASLPKEGSVISGETINTEIDGIYNRVELVLFSRETAILVKLLVHVRCDGKVQNSTEKNTTNVHLVQTKRLTKNQNLCTTLLQKKKQANHKLLMHQSDKQI